MFLTKKNLGRHFTVLILSFIFLFPCVWLLNKSYYTTIDKVNYWEQKQIVSLLSFILKNSKESTVKNTLHASLTDINFFEIKIKHNNVLVIDKPLQKYELDEASTKLFYVADYQIQITKRKYHSFVDDYKHYINTLFTKPNNLFDHRSLVIFLAHLTILLILEILLMVISVKFRLKKLTTSISQKN